MPAELSKDAKTILRYLRNAGKSSKMGIEVGTMTDPISCEAALKELVQSGDVRRFDDQSMGGEVWEAVTSI